MMMMMLLAVILLKNYSVSKTMTEMMVTVRIFGLCFMTFMKVTFVLLSSLFDYCYILYIYVIKRLVHILIN